MSRAAVFVAVTGASAALLALVAALVASERGADVNIWLTMATALVVGLFLAFLWLGPRGKRPEQAEGFEVVSRKKSKEGIRHERERRP